MSVVLVAVGGSALLGAAASMDASKKSSDSTKKGLKQTSALSQQSRDNAMALYNQGRQSAQRGLTSAFDFYKKAAPSRYQPMQLGNVAAQKAIGQGAAQANNAILGNAVDMSFAQPQQINPDMSFIQNAQLAAMDPTIQTGGLIPQGAAAVSQGGGGQSATNQILTAGGLLANPKDMLNPLKAAQNPLGLGDKITSKSPGKKLLKKLF